MSDEPKQQQTTEDSQPKASNQLSPQIPEAMLPGYPPASQANGRQVGGNHYRKIDGEQHWDRVARLQLDPFQYQVTKYVERWRDKGGVQDLKKAAHFLQKYIELVEKGAYKPNDTKPV